jgi:hypothetical protein
MEGPVLDLEDFLMLLMTGEKKSIWEIRIFFHVRYHMNIQLKYLKSFMIEKN